jgi:anti-sigma regulatory factor (Ser/Thr protein kinase)
MHGSQRLSLPVANELTEVPRIVDAMREFCRHHSVSSETIDDVSIALDEVVSNVIRHGDARQFIEVRLALTPHLLEVEVEDDGRPFNPLTAPLPRFDVPAVERGPGGLGIFLTKHMMTELKYRRIHDRNVLTMRRSLSGVRP